MAFADIAHRLSVRYLKAVRRQMPPRPYAALGVTGARGCSSDIAPIWPRSEACHKNWKLLFVPTQYCTTTIATECDCITMASC